MAKPSRVKETGNFNIYDSGILGHPCRFFAEGSAAPGITVPDTGATLKELEEKLKQYSVDCQKPVK